MVSATRQRFNEEFRRNRDAGNKTFEFEGKTYNTKIAPDSKRDMMPPAPKAGKIESSDLAPLPQAMEGMKGRGQPARTQNYSAPGVRMGGKGEPAIVLGGSASDENNPNSFGAKDRKMTQDDETRLRDSIKSMADSDLTPKSGQRPTDSTDTGYRRGGVVKKKATGGMMKKAGGGSIRGCGLATKGHGKMRMF
jgi:hypothetical protein